MNIAKKKKGHVHYNSAQTSRMPTSTRLSDEQLPTYRLSKKKQENPSKIKNQKP
jgi:hypothetical protein